MKQIKVKADTSELDNVLSFADAILEPLWPDNAEMIKKNDKLVLSNPYDANRKVNVVL